MPVEFRIDPVGLDSVKGLMLAIRGDADVAIMRAINRALTGIRTDAVNEIRKEFNLKASVIRDTMKIEKATRNNLAGAYLESKGKPVPFYDKSKGWSIKTQAPGMHFGGKKLSKGFSFLVKHDHGRKKFPGAFTATFESGHTGIFIRKGKGRTPIKELWTSRVPDILSNEERMEPIRQSAAERMQKELDHQVDFLLRR